MDFLIITGGCSLSFVLIHFALRALAEPKFDWPDVLLVIWAAVFAPAVLALVYLDVVFLPSCISATIVWLAWRSTLPAIGVLIGAVLAFLVFQFGGDAAFFLAPAVWQASYAVSALVLVGFRRLHVQRFDLVYGGRGPI